MIYLDNSATTLKKPDCVKEAVWNAMEQMGKQRKRRISDCIIGIKNDFIRQEGQFSEFFDLNHPSGVVFYLQCNRKH